MDKEQRIKELVQVLNRASEEYYQHDEEIMSNAEYDRLYDELVALEEETGIVLSSSPTINVGYEVVSSLPKERHPSPMLSLDKTKDREALSAWLNDQKGLLSWKLDGLTIVLTYEGGRLTRAVTRGDGTIGEVITGNAKVFNNVPLTIPWKEPIVVRGEAVISYPDFEKINETIEEDAAKYKNPRNLCSGTVRQLNSEITARRHVRFFAFALASGGPEAALRSEQMSWLTGQGFETVDYISVDAGTVADGVAEFAERIGDFEIPSDGLVLIYDDIQYGRSLGTTAKFPRDAIAFKWADEMAETKLIEVIWNPSRTGLINPIAVFEPVDLEGTTVSRASVHNLSMVEQLGLAAGDRILVYKANMIIPQIERDLTAEEIPGGAKATAAGEDSAATAAGEETGERVPVEAPAYCPVCGGATQIRDESGVRTVYCPNPDCPAKQIKSFTHFVGREALNIEGLSEATLEKFVDEGMIRSLADIFKLERWRDKITVMEGFGEKSFENIIAATEKASHTTPARLLYGLGIPGIGSANGRVIAKACRNIWERIQALTMDELTSIEGIGDVMAADYRKFFEDEKNRRTVEELLEVLDLDETFEEAADQKLEGKTFVITGSLKHFGNRDQAREEIMALGGKVAGSVSARTDYLVNNDINSGSSKNKKAKELGIPIITEEELIDMIR